MDPVTIYQIIALIVTTAISYAMAPKPVQPKPASLEDFEAPTATEDRAIPVIFGTVWISGANVVWYGDLVTKEIKA